MIVAASVKYKGVFYTGVRHCEIFNDLKRLGHKGPFFESTGYKQGFIDDYGCFFSRAMAKDLVIECKQKYTPLSSTLTSEELW